MKKIVSIILIIIAVTTLVVTSNVKEVIADNPCENMGEYQEYCYVLYDPQTGEPWYVECLSQLQGICNLGGPG